MAKSQLTAYITEIYDPPGHLYKLGIDLLTITSCQIQLLILYERISLKIVSEYDQEILQSQTAV